MGFLFGLFIGITVSIALVVAFARYSNVRSTRRAELVIISFPYIMMMFFFSFMMVCMEIILRIIKRQCNSSFVFVRREPLLHLQE